MRSRAVSAQAGPRSDNWIREGRFPRPVKLGAKMRRWRSDVIDRWIEERTGGTAA